MSDDSPRDDEGHVILRTIIFAAAICWGFSIARIAVYLDLYLDKVDDPIDRDTGARVHAALVLAIVVQARIRDLDGSGNVRRPWMPFFVPARRTPDHCDVWLPFTVAL